MAQSRNIPLKYSPFIELNKGLCDALDAISIPDGCMQICQNAYIDGNIKKRPGRTLYGTAIGTTVRAVTEFVDSAGSLRIIAVANSKIWELTGAAPTEIGAITNEPVTFAIAAGGVYINGATVQIRIERTSALVATLIIKTVGLAAPAATPTLGAITGTLTGSYAYLVTFAVEVSSALYQESNPCPVGTALAVTTQGIRLSSVPVSADAKTTHRYIYRTTDGGSKFYFLGKIANNSATTYDDAGTVVDTVLGSEVARNHGTPSLATDMELCNSRMFSCLGVNLMWSQIGRPAVPFFEYQNSLDFHALPAAITSLKTLYNTGTGVEDLFIFTASSVWVLPNGDQSVPPQRIRSDLGCSAPESIREYNGRLVFLSSRGTVEFLAPSGSIDISTLRIPVTMLGIVEQASARATIWGNYYLLSVRTASTVATSTVTLCCDLRTVFAVTSTTATAVWSTWLTAIDFWIMSSAGLLGISATDGNCYKYAVGALDDEIADGSEIPIVFVVRTKDLSGESLFVKKRPCRLSIKCNSFAGFVVTPYYSNGPTAQSATSETLVGRAVFIAGTSKAGDAITRRGNLLETALSAECTGETFSFQIEQSARDLGLSIIGLQYTYLSYARGL